MVATTLGHQVEAGWLISGGSPVASSAGYFSRSARS